MVVICAQWRMGWWRGPNLLNNGVFLLTLIRTLHPRDAPVALEICLTICYPNIHLSQPCRLRCQSHASGSRTRSDRSPDPTVLFQYATAFNKNISRWNVVQNSSLPTDFSDQSALTQTHFPIMWGTWPPAMTITSSDVVNGIANGVSVTLTLFTANQDVGGFTKDDSITSTNGVLSAFNITSASIYSAIFTPLHVTE